MLPIVNKPLIQYSVEEAIEVDLTQIDIIPGRRIPVIEEVPHKQTANYGFIAGEEIEPGLYQVRNMTEKPKPGDAPSNLAIICRYILSPDIFDILRNTKPSRVGEIQITDVTAE